MEQTIKRMRPSRVLQKMRAGEVAVCTKLNIGNARVAEIAALSGIDCIWTDMEHVPNDWSAIESQINAAKMHNVDTVVRVAKGSYSDFIRPLEMDASGIMIPHVMNLAEAKSIVRSTKFHPIGLRPVDGGNADGAYCEIEFIDYLQQANEQRFNILQIEDPEPLDELEEIIKLPGVDMIFFGPGDFTQAIGFPGQWDHPKLIETRRLIAKLAQKHAKFAGTVGSVSNWDELVSLGYNFISVGADVVGLGNYYKQLLDDIKKKHTTTIDGIYSNN
ncbi:aldolase [Paenibacillus psychroresistens]|uniref:Aldolase n=1 Tax=Paenibacillus psychroresistens TaxID=1778678 RepID=A0A6B8RIY1_9BACL|nr:aldolase/citrate lyase family protein [Paenibacillus psychroresistens]QGQ95575.1 aldolase [Paenibacillus psychroresistens]